VDNYPIPVSFIALSYLKFLGSPSTMMPTSVAISAAEKEEAALVELRVGDLLFHGANVIHGFLCINLGRVE
jgi:hypothetical protein